MGLLIAVIVLAVLTVGLGGTTAYLWSTRGLGESDQPISLPSQVGDYDAVPAKDIQFDENKTSKSFQKTYHTAAMIREYQTGKGDAEMKLTILAVRTKLPAPQPLYHSRDSKYAQHLEEAKPGIWCVSRRLSERQGLTPDNCIKSGRGLSLMLGHYTYKGKITVADLADLTEKAYASIK